jgi:hypothetical protein
VLTQLASLFVNTSRVNSSGTLAEQPTHYPKIKVLNPATGTGESKGRKRKKTLQLIMVKKLQHKRSSLFVNLPKVSTHLGWAWGAARLPG